MSDDPCVLVVEDEDSVRLAIVQTLGLAGLVARAIATAEEATALVTAGHSGVVLSDVRLPGRSGLDLLATAMRVDRELPVVLLTGHGDVSMAVEAMRAGAYDFIEKPYRAEHLVEVLRRALEKRRLVLENRALRVALGAGQSVPPLVGDSPSMRRMRQFVATVGPLRTDVTILGETGSGKEVVAQHLHAAGASGARFVAVNCAAIPESMFESEMFGHEAGAFTSAAKRRVGKVEYAQGGTLFLDEIESLPLAMQAKLLRVLQERRLERLGGNESVAVEFRVVAATKVDLLAEADAGRFRADLYYRLATVMVRLAPLRERVDDIPALFERFVHDASIRHARPLPAWSTAQMAAWQTRPWRGNVRELKAHAERYVLGLDEEVPGDGAATLPERIGSIERRLVRDALAECGGSVSLAAERLGIPKKTLYDKLKRHALGVDG